MASFLALIDYKFKVIDVLWSDPVYLISRSNASFLDIYNHENQNKIKDLIAGAQNQKNSVQCEDLTLNNLNLKMSICILSSDDYFVVFSTSTVNHSIDSDIIQIIHRFMKVIHNYSRIDKLNYQESSSSQFENIQLLNNELINTRRMLEKINAQKQLLNEDLNNRLVKDPLTNLVSRYQYREEIQLLISNSPKKFGIFTFLDIDNFKSVNDTYGHAVGDQYLIEFANRLKSLPLENAIFMRISGDEFGMYVHGYDQVDDTESLKLWEMIKENILTEPILIGDKKLPIGVSAGMSIYNRHTDSIYPLIEYADFAMYIAKKNGKNNMHIFNETEFDAAKEE